MGGNISSIAFVSASVMLIITLRIDTRLGKLFLLARENNTAVFYMPFFSRILPYDFNCIAIDLNFYLMTYLLLYCFYYLMNIQSCIMLLLLPHICWFGWFWIIAHVY